LLTNRPIVSNYRSAKSSALNSIGTPCGVPIGGAIPGVVIAVKRCRVGDALVRDHALERRKPVPIVGFPRAGSPAAAI